MFYMCNLPLIDRIYSGEYVKVNEQVWVTFRVLYIWRGVRNAFIVLEIGVILDLGIFSVKLCCIQDLTNKSII